MAVCLEKQHWKAFKKHYGSFNTGCPLKNELQKINLKALKSQLGTEQFCFLQLLMESKGATVASF
jgi:hypothetical protein